MTRGAIDLKVVGDRLDLAGFRNRLTHHYADLSPEELFTLLASGIPDLVAVAQALQDSAERLAGASD